MASGQGMVKALTAMGLNPKTSMRWLTEVDKRSCKYLRPTMVAQLKAAKKR
jgi:hypothetical protein